MVENLELLKCFHCGESYHFDEHGENIGMICSGCGVEVIPLVNKEKGIKDQSGRSAVLGYFAIVALLGALGGIMVGKGGSAWITFAVIGGSIYFIYKIFTEKYTIHQMEIYPLFSDKAALEFPKRESGKSFDQLVVNAVHELPQSLRKYLSNLAIVLEDKPKDFVREKMKLQPDSILLGLFEGVPLNKRSVWHSAVLPEKITLYRNNIEAVCSSDDEIKQKIKTVVCHEIAHFFGFTEEEIRNLGY